MGTLEGQMDMKGQRDMGYTAGTQGHGRDMVGHRSREGTWGVGDIHGAHRA